MDIETAQKAIDKLPTLLETSTGRWIEAQSAKQSAAINLLKSNWSEPANNDANFDQLKTRLFAFVGGNADIPRVLATVRSQNVDGINQILEVDYDLKLEHISYEMFRLGHQEQLAIVREKHRNLFIKHPGRTEAILNSELNQYCGLHDCEKQTHG